MASAEPSLRQLLHSASGEIPERLREASQTIESFLRSEYYPWVQAACPYFTDHGQGHIAAVFESADRLLAEHLRRGDVNALEAYILCMAIPFHDAAMIYGRLGHEERAGQVLERYKALIPDQTLMRSIQEVVRAHSGRNGLRIPRREQRIALDGRTHTVRPRALAAVLRLADEISETRSRIAIGLIESVPEPNRIYWEYASVVTASTPLDSSQLGIDYEAELSSVARAWPCSEGWVPPPGKVPLIEFMAHRMEKMNLERAYCRAASGGLLTQDSIRVSITLTQDNSRLPNFDGDIVMLGDRGAWLDDTEYPEIRVASGFFGILPKYDIVALSDYIRNK